MAVPTITQLPPPPLPTDAEADFDANAGASLTAQVQMVVQINASLTWIGQQVTTIDGYRQAAATSATASATSATAAANSATQATTNGAAQVALAAAQAQAATTAKTDAQAALASTQAVAAAVQSSAGLPSLAGNAYKVLGVNATSNGVAWVYGLPNLTTGKPGQSVLLNSAKAPYWDYAGQQVGDVLITSRNPGPLYLPANGSIRSQAAYPLLFSQVGLVGGVVGESWVTGGFNLPIAANSVKASSSGTVLAATNTAVAPIYRSPDRGATWEAFTLPDAGISKSIGDGGIDTDNNGTWIVCDGVVSVEGTLKIFRSVDDGRTWQAITAGAVISGGGRWWKVCYIAPGIFILLSNFNTVLLRTQDNGATWTPINPGFGTARAMYAPCANSAGTVMISDQNTCKKSTDYGLTWANVGQAGVMNIATDKLGQWLLLTNNPQTTKRSLDDAQTFATFPIGTLTSMTFSALFAYDKIFLHSASSQTLYQYVPATALFSNIASANSIIFSQPTDAGLGVLLSLGAGNLTTNRLSKSLPAFGYDTTSQFALPNVTAPSGLKSFIKVQEAV
ncbi:sialidase family protein [Pseudomonas syringae]|uniref:Sialidase family protein n=1 Tax=Pseudomonas syringae CC1417 TaxID=1357272 RepID=A0AAU8LE34_PSESX